MLYAEICPKVRMQNALPFGSCIMPSNLGTYFDIKHGQHNILYKYVSVVAHLNNTSIYGFETIMDVYCRHLHYHFSYIVIRTHKLKHWSLMISLLDCKLSYDTIMTMVSPYKYVSTNHL